MNVQPFVADALLASADVATLRLALIALLLCTGCEFPRDADGTLHRVQGGTLRVGIVANQPWVVDAAEPSGVEPRLVHDIAAAAGARVTWIRMPEFEIVRALQERQLDLAIGGFDRKVPWAGEVALTREYIVTADGRAHVMAAPPGENAWLVFVERQLRTDEDAVPSLLSAEAR